MDLSDIIIRVQREFGDDAGVQITPEDIVRWVEDAQLELAIKLECIIKNAAPITSVNGQASYPLPDDFFKFREVMYDNAILTKTTLAELDNINSGRLLPPVQNGVPYLYYNKGKTIFLHYVPNTSGLVLNVEYVARPTAVVNTDSDLEIPDEYHIMIVSYCMARARTLDGDFKESQNQMSIFEAKSAQAMTDSHWPFADEYPSIRTPFEDY